jgi:hypothetical protein
VRAQTIVTRSFNTSNQQSDTKQSNRTYTAPEAKKNGKQPFPAFDRVGGSRMQGMSICSMAEASSGSFDK